MKKIMFNDFYGLTAAVLNGKKTMTRRIIKAPRCTIEGKEVCGFAIHKTPDGVPYEVWLTGPDEESLCQLLPTYKVGEIVAVAQNYKDAGYTPDLLQEGFFHQIGTNTPMEIRNTPEEYIGKWMECHFDELSGWSNKMFVLADLMPHHIRITDIKVERLQDISDEDCLREGIQEYFPYIDRNPNDKVRTFQYFKNGKIRHRISPASKCFAYLIDDISGKGTWDSNPWVFAYSFELIK